VENHRINPAAYRGAPAAAATLAPLAVSYWFTEPQFYLVALLYMATRLFVNLSQAYVPLFIQVTVFFTASVMLEPGILLTLAPLAVGKMSRSSTICIAYVPLIIQVPVLYRKYIRA
jgi:hypothetical protein